MIERIKQKWNIRSNWQLIVILFVFAATGCLALMVRKLAFKQAGITPETSLWIKIPLFFIVVFPTYQVMLVVIGGLCGQFRFFYAFQKRNFSFLLRKREVKLQIEVE